MYEILKLFTLARPVSICWESREFCLAVSVIISSVVPALRVGDSKAFEDSAPGYNIVEEQCVFLESR